MVVSIGNPSDKSNANELRKLMPALQNKYYFNYGGQGPLPIPSLEAIKNSWLKIQDLGPFTNNVWPYIATEIESTKELLGKICGVKKNQIALTQGLVRPICEMPYDLSLTNNKLSYPCFLYREHKIL